MGCAVTLRQENATNTDVMIIKPASTKARVVSRGKALDTGLYVTAGSNTGGGSCMVFGAGGSGGGGVSSATVTASSGTPYVVTSIQVVG